ncbi:MAG: BamA/TamA family outer membrane protein [Bacteroidales bacterium]
MIVQDPNTTFLGMRIKLGLYNLSKDSIHNWWNRRMRESGEAPVVFDSSTIDNSIDRITGYINNRGYFEPKICAQVQRRKRNSRKVVVNYYIQLNTPYTLKSIALQILDDSLSLPLKNWQSNTLLSPGNRYDVDFLNKERDRITLQLLNYGYWAFSREYIYFQIDSTLGSHQMDVLMFIKKVSSNEIDSTGNPILLHHKPYYFDKIYFAPETRAQALVKNPHFDTLCYNDLSKKDRKRHLTAPNYYFLNQGKPIIKPRTLIQKTFLEEGALFNATNVSKSYDNISDLRIFGYSNINITEKAYDSTKSYYENNLLNCQVNMIQNPKFGFSVEAELTTSSGIQGFAANVSFQDRNLFGGGEVLNVRLRGAYEIQASIDENRNKSFLNTFEAKAEVSIDFPRFLAPISIERFSKYFRPKSTVTLGYSFQTKKDYSRGIFNASWGYSWKKNHWSHLFNPIEINTIQMINPSKTFLANLEALSQNSLRLKYQYENHFILNLRYAFSYNDQGVKEKGFNHLRIGVETAGNLLYAIAAATCMKKEANGQYEMFNLAFSQYVRLEADYKHHFIFAKNVVLVLRGMIGTGLSYGNSQTMPYEKSFYIGGSNTLRAWPIYRLGPGGYYNPSKPDLERLGDLSLVLNIEQRFPIFAGLRGAIFIDAGNVWLLRRNPDFPKGEFRFKNFYKEIAIGTGVGLRYDFGFFLLRVDVGIPVRNPAVAPGKSHWVIGQTKWKDVLFNFGIGYPF